jgi:hypothetical protein
MSCSKTRASQKLSVLAHSRHSGFDCTYFWCAPESPLPYVSCSERICSGEQTKTTRRIGLTSGWCEWARRGKGAFAEFSSASVPKLVYNDESSMRDVPRKDLHKELGCVPTVHCVLVATAFPAKVRLRNIRRLNHAGYLIDASNYYRHTKTIPSLEPRNKQTASLNS